MPTHDLRNKQWSYVPQANPDGRTTIVRIGDDSDVIMPGDFIIISSRYVVTRVNLDRVQELLTCEHAPRTLAEIARASSPEALQEAM
jgi:hypothetical protein